MALCRIAAAACASLAACAGAADDSPDPAFKLTGGWYRYSDGTSGVDTNLRHTSDLGNIWLGYFRTIHGFSPRAIEARTARPSRLR